MVLVRAVFSSLAFGSAAFAASSSGYNSASNGKPTTFSVWPTPSTCAVTTTITTTVTYSPTNAAEVKPTGTMGMPSRVSLPDVF